MSSFYLRETDGVYVLVCHPLRALDLLVATSTRLGDPTQGEEDAPSLNAFQGELGSGEGSRRSALAPSFASFLAAVGMRDRPLITLRQQHGTRCVILDPESVARYESEPPPGDAIVAEAGEAVLGIQTADCAPVFLFDARTRVRAAIHAGWRGTLGRLTERVIALMKARFGTRPEECHAAIGPTIGPCCYEVGPDVLNLFRRAFSYAEAVLSRPTPSGTAFLDLVEATRRQLLACGIPPTQIAICGLCTSCHPHLFFSHRRDSRSGRRVGRMLSVIADLRSESRAR